MAKIRLTGATFDASAQTVVHASFSDITLAGIQLIVNVTDQIIIYNFADTAKGGTLATDTLTLEHDTTSMSDTDELMILVEDGSATLPISGTVTANLSATDNAVLDNIDADLTTIIGHVDGIEALLGTIDADTSNISTKIDTLAGAVSGTEMQVDVLTSALPTGASTLAEQQSQTTHLATIAGDTTDIEAAVELIDDTVATLGTTTYTEAATKGLIIGAVRRDADTTLVDTTNEIGPLQMNAAGQLKVEVFSGETLPVSLTSTTITGTVAVTQSGTWDEVGINDSGNSITVDGTVSVTGVSTLAEQQTQTTALQLIDDVVYTDDTSTHATGTSKGVLLMGAATPTDGSVSANDIGALAMTVNRELHVSLTTALPAGTAGIGKLTANSGVDIGDVDVLSIIPGTGATNLGKAIDTATGATDTGVLALATRDDDLGTLTPADADNVQLRTDSEGALWATLKPQPTEGTSTLNSTSSDGGTALTNSAQAIKASAGTLYGYYIYNPNATAQFVQFFNTASGSVTVGTTNPLFMLTIPATSAANLSFAVPVVFGTAMSWAATSTAGGNGAPSSSLDAVAWYK